MWQVLSECFCCSLIWFDTVVIAAEIMCQSVIVSGLLSLISAAQIKFLNEITSLFLYRVGSRVRCIAAVSGYGRRDGLLCQRSVSYSVGKPGWYKYILFYFFIICVWLLEKLSA